MDRCGRKRPQLDIRGICRGAASPARGAPVRGRSAHTEAGWMAGAGKRVIAYIPEMVEPELMYKLFDAVVGDLDELVKVLD